MGLKVRRLKTEPKVVGAKQTLKYLEKDMVLALYLAKDAEKRVTDPILELAKQKNIEVMFVDSMKLLGDACSIEVKTAVAGIIKKEV
ncbi:MAG: ribosomal protein L7Ae-like protein [Clostridiales bacterium GWD2_32_59]|nr:MAG: ribosomal protein L7Ae-like protein [Clostridiales bacterium GWD2_32_59]